VIDQSAKNRYRVVGLLVLLFAAGLVFRSLEKDFADRL